jgi:hypothetical protein
VQNGLTELNDAMAAQDRIAAAIETADPAVNVQHPHSPGKATEGQINRAVQAPVNPERAFWSWLGFWVLIVVLAVLAIVGAFAASAA